MNIKTIFCLTIGLLCSSGLIKGDFELEVPTLSFPTELSSSKVFLKESLNDEWIDVATLASLDKPKHRFEEIVTQDELSEPSIPGTWKISTMPNICRVFPGFSWYQNNKKGIFFYMKYQPKNHVIGKEPLAVILIHGTFASVDNQEFTGKVLDKLKEQIARMAERAGRPTKLFSFGWSGEDNDRERMVAGQQLGFFINTHLKGHKIVSFDHSHGGNVQKHSVSYLKVPMDIVIHTGTPIIQGVCADQYTVVDGKVGLELNFLSTCDAVQYLGGNNLHKVLWHNIKSGFDTLSGWINRTKNDEDMIKPLSYASSTGTMFSADRKIRGINIRTQFKGYDPDHGLIKLAVVEKIATILEILEKEYGTLIKAAQKSIAKKEIDSLDFDLNIDPSLPLEEHQMLLALRNEEKNTLFKDNRFAQERRFSDSQKRIYKAIYKKDISDKGSIMARIKNHGYNAYALVFG